MLNNLYVISHGDRGDAITRLDALEEFYTRWDNENKATKMKFDAKLKKKLLDFIDGMEYQYLPIMNVFPSIEKIKKELSL